MKRTILAILVILAFGTMAWAETVGDIDGDGMVGLKEAVHALQVSAGIRTTSATPTYDFAEYFWADGEFLYNVIRRYDYIPQPGTELVSHYQETLDELDILVTEIRRGDIATGVKYFYYIGDSQVKALGAHDPYSATDYGYTPPYTMGSRSTKKGDIFYNLYEFIGDYEYREYIFLGLEDVTVPAGTFQNCMKVLLKQSRATNNYTASYTYYAKNIGAVKYVSNSGYVRELTYARIGEKIYPENASLCSAQGNFITNVDGHAIEESGEFFFSFNREQNPVYVTIYVGDAFYNSYYLVSTDGIHFTLNQEAYTDTSYLPKIEFTLDNGSISGTGSGVGEEIILTGNYSCSE